MRILHVINNLALGGAEKLLQDLLPFLNDDSNHTELVILSSEGNVFYESIVKSGVKVHLLKHDNLYDPRNVIELVKIIKSNRYSIVHSHIFPTQYWVAFASLFINRKITKFVTTEHSTYNRRRSIFLLRNVEKFIYSRYDSIISITEKSRDNLLKWLSPSLSESGKFVIIKNGINLETVENALPYKKSELNPNLTEEHTVLCMAGRFVEAKDQSTIIRSLLHLNDNIHLILVGDGDLQEKNISLTKSLNIQNRVHFLGYRNDVARIMKTSDFIIQSSKWEGLSLASIEGLASGKPFIATRVEGLEEVVGNAGLLFEMGDTLELSRIIIELIEDEEFYKKVALKCMEESKLYSISNMKSELIELYLVISNGIN